MSKRILQAVLFAVLAAEFYSLQTLGRWSFEIKPGHTLFELLAMVTAVVSLYHITVTLITLSVRRHGGPDGEIVMLKSFVRLVATLGVIATFVYSLGLLKTIGVVAAGFAGMILGWSLQAPVSGLAAWLMITLMRPFRVTDRVQFPSLGLTGDVKRVGLMYTILDQVGGTIGSEDPIGRDILIPNAMLFSQVAINYTVKTRSAFFLDEVVVRLTYDSDWDTAEEILLNAARSVTHNVIAETGHEPYVRSDMWDYGILLRLRYMTMAKDRPRITHEIVRSIFKNIQNDPRVDMAIPFVYSYRKGSSSPERRHFPEPEGAMKEIPIGEIADPLGPQGSAATEEEINEIVLSIREQGLLQPILLERSDDGRYTVLAGELRFLACKRLGWKTVPAVLKPRE